MIFCIFITLFNCFALYYGSLGVVELADVVKERRKVKAMKKQNSKKNTKDQTIICTCEDEDDCKTLDCTTTRSQQKKKK